MDNIDTLEQKAVEAAINLNWDQAINLNNEILQEFPDDIKTILRLGYAYLQKKEFSKAKMSYKMAFQYQPKHPVATEQIKKINILQGKVDLLNNQTGTFDPNLFLEMPGKTKSIPLVQLGNKNDLTELSIGQELYIKIRKKKVELRTKEGKYIGAVPDDLSKRLLSFLEDGSVYKTFVKEALANKVILFIKEISKGPNVANITSFPEDPAQMLEKVNKKEKVKEKNENAKDDSDTENDSEEDEDDTDDSLELDDSGIGEDEEEDHRLKEQYGSTHDYEDEEE